MSRYDDLIEGVDPKWRPAFRTFVETAEADEGFLEYISTNPACERAVELAIQREAESLGDLSALLAKSIAREPDMVSRSMANAIRTVIDLDAAEQGQVLSATARQLERELGMNAKPLVIGVVTTLEDQLTH